MKALGLVVLEKLIFLCFPMTPPGQGPYGPQRHSWQDLYRGPLYIATHKIEKLWALWFWIRRFFYVFPIVSLWELMAWLAGFIKRTTKLCYIQNMKALGLVVSEKKIFLCFSHEAPWGGAYMDPRGMVGRIYEEDLYILLLPKYESSGPCGFGEEDFFTFFPL